ncbi:hypothetical protein Vretimale_6833 [Volvox reticuliferus]|uniref:Nudix hydrolase domain-containing protein n=1 Tax=Volvox reticuliferus TaxID=1737510 RepID=A0A8J4G8J8_9CHLO|nr:hypothetical protein Vretimale_6833 [Volvox reticuliferus]
MWSLGSSLHLTQRVLSSCRQARKALSGLTTAAGSSSGAGKSRAYPTEPRVGVGVVVFRTHPVQGQDPEILLVRRAKNPDKGRWCFPGGSLELGETLAACAAREVEEEAGLRLRGGVYGTSGAGSHAGTGAAAATTAASDAAGGVMASASAACVSSAPAAGIWSLANGPIPFAAVDVMSRDADGRIQFHYAVIEVAALSFEPDAVPIPGDDADGAQWVPVSRLRHMSGAAGQALEVVQIWEMRRSHDEFWIR